MTEWDFDVIQMTKTKQNNACTQLLYWNNFKEGVYCDVKKWKANCIDFVSYTSTKLLVMNIPIKQIS